MQSPVHILIKISFLLILLGCETPNLETLAPTVNSVPPTPIAEDLDTPLRQLIDRYQLQVLPSPMSNITTAKAQLGMQLFFSNALGAKQSTNCATCHHPLSAGSDELALSMGVDAANSQALLAPHTLNLFTAIVPRNAPTTFNSSLWQSYLLHSGYIEPNCLSKETTCEPLLNAVVELSHLELRIPNKVEQLYWRKLYAKAFNLPLNTKQKLITKQHTAQALTAYLQAQTFLNNPWFAYIQGDQQALNDQAKRGALLFYRTRPEGGFDCVQCHSGTNFTDEQFHNLLMPILYPQPKADAEPIIDYGRWFITQKTLDKFRFRTPSLLNVAETAPWGHNGAYSSLSGIIKHMLDPYQSLLNYDSSQIRQPHVLALPLKQTIQEMLSMSNGDLVKQTYTEAQIQELVAFLNTLTDPCIKQASCMKAWLPAKPLNQANNLPLLFWAFWH
jgi:cytochrome c peroxidase